MGVPGKSLYCTTVICPDSACNYTVPTMDYPVSTGMGHMSIGPSILSTTGLVNTSSVKVGNPTIRLGDVDGYR